MPRAQLILYAIPTGLLAEQCVRFFRMASTIAPTVAQTYPPHCSLTGFFSRSPQTIDALADALHQSLDEVGLHRSGRVESCDVVVHGLRRQPDWVGLELGCERMRSVAAAFARRCAGLRQPGDDIIRLKDWLHLSLAYDTDTTTLDRHGSLAAAVIDASLSCDWEIALFRRHPGDVWQRLTPMDAAMGHASSPHHPRHR